jgi:hypothetical protein
MLLPSWSNLGQKTHTLRAEPPISEHLPDGPFTKKNLENLVDRAERGEMGERPSNPGKRCTLKAEPQFVRTFTGWSQIIKTCRGPSGTGGNRGTAMDPRERGKSGIAMDNR